MKTVHRSILTVVVGLSFSASLHADLLHHWTLDESSGLIAADRNCAGNGDLVGFELADDAQWTDGNHEGGLDLGVDGSFDNRVVADLSATNGTTEFTIAMWIQPGEVILNTGEYQLLATPADTVGFTIMNFDNGVERHDRVLLFWDGNLQNLHVGTTTLEPDEWYHVAITSTGTLGEKLYYINGVLEPQLLFLPDQGGTQDVHPGNVDGWPAGQGAIGALVNGARAHDTVIDDVRIYDNALSEAEIAAVMDDAPALAPTIENVSPEDGNASHVAADGLAFDVLAMAAGATIPAENISLILNGEDVSGQLDVAGTDTNREVLFDALVENSAYEARIEATDSNGTLACFSLSFGTLTDTVPGLLHYFAMDESAGLTALDTGSARNGQLLGFEANDDAQWVGGICENGLNLGADLTINNYVEFTANAVNAFETGGFTVAMWLNPGAAILNTGEYQLLSTPDDTVGFTIMNFDGELRHDRVLLFWDGVLSDLHVGTTTLEPGTWYHVAITSTGFGGDKLYYVNGVLEEQALFLPSQGGVEGVHPGNVDGWAEGVARIGAIGAGGRAHDSILDDFRIYDRALDAEEILEVLEECDPVLCNPLSLADLSPSDGDSFHDATAGIEFEVSTPNAGFEINAGDITLELNGVDVSGALAVGGNATTRTVTFDGLAESTAYVARLSVTDGCSTLQREIQFGTFVQCDADIDGLRHYWSLDEGGGLFAFDCVGGSLHSLIGFEDNDSQWVAGQVDGGLDFGSDGVLDNAMEGPISAMSAAENGGYTIALWIQPGEQILTVGEYQLFVAPGGLGFTIMNFDGELRHDRVLLFWDGNLTDLHVGTTTLEPGTWYHVAVTSTGVGGEKLYYINGAPEDQTLFLPSQGGTEGFHPGNFDGWPEGVARWGANFAGRNHDTVYDDIRVFDRALSLEEIALLADQDPGDQVGPFLRGDCSQDGQRNLTDGIFLLNFLFLGGTEPSCDAACDTNADGELNITTAVALFNFLFLGGPPPADPAAVACERSSLVTDIAHGCADPAGCQ